VAKVPVLGSLPYSFVITLLLSLAFDDACIAVGGMIGLVDIPLWWSVVTWE